MASSKNLAYNLDYENSYVTTSPKKQMDSEYKKVCDNNKSRTMSNINAHINNKLATKNKFSMFVTILIISTLFAILSCRYNVISEKNLTIQRLNIDLAEAQTELTNAQIALSGMVDIEEIESYAKQQLGMREISKNQIVYVETDTMTGFDSPTEETIFEKIENFVLKLFN